MPKVLITGANGFIGSHLVESALQNGFEVVAGVRKGSSLQYIENKNITIAIIDYSDINSIVSYLTDIQYVIHNAGLTQTSDLGNFRKVNFLITKNLIEAIKISDHIPSKFVHISSLSSYGPGNELNMKPVEIHDIQKPVTEYGRSKLEAENYIKLQLWLPSIIFNPTIVFGPREKNLLTMFRLIKNHVEPYIGFNYKMLSFIYVKDFAKVVINSLLQMNKNSQFFVSDCNSYSLNYFNKLIKKELQTFTIPVKIPISVVASIALVIGKISSLIGKPSIINNDKVNELKYNNWVCNSQPIWEELKFKPEYPLERGIKETIEWYKSEKWL